LSLAIHPQDQSAVIERCISSRIRTTQGTAAIASQDRKVRMRKDLDKRRSLWSALAGVVLLAGCGTDLITAEGNVVWDGKPVENGTISFAPSDSMGPTIGGGIKDGKYRLEGEGGVTPGKKTVIITAARQTGKQIEVGPPAPPGTMVDDVRTISEKMTCEIVAGQANQHDFEITSSAATK
jgi:hypothetical protein